MNDCNIRSMYSTRSSMAASSIPRPTQSTSMLAKMSVPELFRHIGGHFDGSPTEIVRQHQLHGRIAWKPLQGEGKALHQSVDRVGEAGKMRNQSFDETQSRSICDRFQ